MRLWIWNHIRVIRQEIPISIRQRWKQRTVWINPKVVRSIRSILKKLSTAFPIDRFLKTAKPNNEESKEISRSASAERKHSLVKMNRTEANFEGEDI